MWDKDSCSDAGMIKLDLLGLPTLGAVERCVETIYKRRGVRVELSRIPRDDPRVYERIRKARSLNFFGFSSRAQQAYAQMTQPQVFFELVVEQAIVRPGAMGSGETRGYIKARQEQLHNPAFQPTYLHPSLEEPLRRTLGTVVFQDQILEIGRAVAGFTPGQAEAMRRAMSRKRSAEAMNALYEQFAEGARRTHPGISQTVIDRIWLKVLGFAAGFGFPEAHAWSWALLGWDSAWLDTYYPPEYLVSLLNEQPLGFYAPDTLIHGAKHRGINTLPPDVVHSDLECTLTDDDSIRLGPLLHQGTPRRRHRAADRIAPRRRALPLTRGPRRTRRRQPTRTRTARLVRRLRHPDRPRRASPPHSLVAARRSETGGETKDGDQLGLELPLADVPELPALTAWEAMLADYETKEVSIDPQPIGLLREQLTRAGATSIAALSQVAHGRHVKVGGLVAARQRPETAKGITFLLLEDETGLVNTVVYPVLYDKERLLVRGRALVLVEGELQRRERDGGAINLVAESIQALGNEDGQPAPVKRLPTGEQTSFRGDEFEALAPAVTSFAQGRRR